MIYYVPLTDDEVERIFLNRKFTLWLLDDEIKEWLDENVDWGYSDCVKDRIINFTFMCEEDAVAFKLRWL